MQAEAVTETGAAGICTSGPVYGRVFAPLPYRHDSGICNNWPMSMLDRIRRNHALEHATLAVLARGGDRGLFAGYSTAGGFWLLAPSSTEMVRRASEAALARLCRGESQLAISRSCGTNIVVAALIAAAAIRLMGVSDSRKRTAWPLRAAIALGAVVLARPIGDALQRRFTTLSAMDGLTVTGVNTFRLGRFRLHRVATAENAPGHRPSH